MGRCAVGKQADSDVGGPRKSQAPFKGLLTEATEDFRGHKAVKMELKETVGSDSTENRS